MDINDDAEDLFADADRRKAKKTSFDPDIDVDGANAGRNERVCGNDAGKPTGAEDGREPLPASRSLVASPVRSTETERSQFIEDVAVADLKPNPRNARRHSPEQIEKIAANIRAFGFNGVLVIDENRMVLAGHGRLAAALLVGLPSVPCLRVDHLSPAAKQAFALGDNRLAEMSDWDDDGLATQLRELEGLDLNFDLEVTGFDTVDLDRLLGPELQPKGGRRDADGYSTDPDDRIPDLRTRGPAVSRRGHLWILGQHKVLCGDALNTRDYERLLDGERVTQVVTDSPYNVKIRGHVSSKREFREFAMGSGEFSSTQFTEFLASALGNAANVCIDGAILYAFMDWKHLPEILAAAKAAFLTLMNLCVWTKPSAGMGSFYRGQHELVLVLKSGTGSHINNFGLGARGRYRSNVWAYPSVRGPRRGISGPEAGHPTPKPVACLIDAIKDCSKRGDIILDMFGGSGSTLIAAERVGRKARLIEIDAHYVDLTVRRWQALTGQAAILASDGRSFDTIEQQGRAASADDEGTEGDRHEQE